MTDDKNIPDNATASEPQQAATATAAAGPASANWHTWMAAVAAILSIAAWVALCVDGYAAFGVGVCAFVTACLGLHAHTRSWRNLATTALIASGVILVVIAAFLVVIFWGLNSI